MLEAGLAGCLVAYLPGALVFRLPICDRARRAALAAEERVFWAVLISAAWSTLIVIGLAGLESYTFTRLLIVNGVLSGLLVLAGRQGLLYRGEAARPGWRALIPAAIAVFGWWLITPPFEYVMGGKDPGVYMNEGIQIAQRGSLVTRDPVVAAVPAALSDLFHPQQDSEAYYAVRFMGFFIKDPAAGTVIGQFAHGYPASIAVGYGLHGLTGARFAVGAWAVLGWVAVYLMAVRIAGHAAGTAAAVLLVMNVASIWYARYPTAEMPVSALLFGAMLAFTRLVDGDRRFFGFVAGALLGIQLFFRYDAILAIAAFSAAAVLIAAVRARVGWAFPAALVLTGSAGFWYLAVPMAAGTGWYVEFTRNEGGVLLLAAPVVAIAYRWLVRQDRWASLARQLAPAGLVAILLVLAGHAWFLREPVPEVLAIEDVMALRSFSWYVTPAGLLAAMLGLAVLAPARFWQAPAFFLTLAAHAVFFFYKMRIVHEHFWAARRFMPMLLPAALVLAAGGVAWLLAPERLRRWRGAAAPFGWRAASTAAIFVVLTPLGLAVWSASAPVRAHVEYAGLIPQLEHLAANVGDRDLLLVESREADTDLHVLALPLAYIYARNVLVLDSSRPDKRKLEDFLRWAGTTYDRVLFMGGGGSDLLSRHIEAERLSSLRFGVPEYQSVHSAYPAGVHSKEFDITIFELRPALGFTPGPIDIDVGGDDDLNVVNFFAKEQNAEGVRFRWTKQVSRVLLLGVEAGARQVVVWMSSGGRPAPAPPGEVRVSIDGVELGAVTPADEVRPYRFDLPPELAGQAGTRPDPLSLRLEVSVWNPRGLLGAPDSRDLGVIVTRVQVQ